MQGALDQPQIFKFYNHEMRQQYKQEKTTEKTTLSAIYQSSGLMFQCQTPAKFRGYNQPTAKAVPVQIKAQISFFQHIFSWVSQVPWYSSIEYKFLYTLTMYDIFNSCKCLWLGSVNVHILVSAFHYYFT